MESVDFDDFGERLTVLGEIFDASLSPAKVALYFEALRDVPTADVLRALNQAARSCRFFPKPVELRALAVGDEEDHAERAWLAFRRALSRVGAYASIVMDDVALGDTVLALFGSWPAACQQDLTPEMWTATRKEFGRVYRICRDRHSHGPRYLLGICEQENGSRAEWQQFVAVSRLTVDGLSRTLSLVEADQARTTCGLLTTAAHDTGVTA